MQGLTVRGTPHQMGYAHGAAFTEAVRHVARDRVALVEGGTWSGKPLARREVLALAEACLPAHEAYAPDLMDELRGMAAATGLSLAELLIAGGFTDFVDTVYNLMQGEGRLPLDDCTAFLVPDAAAEGAGFLGQTWDMHASAEPYVLLLRLLPDDGPAVLTFTLMGCVGMVGMNAHGVAVGINNLMATDGQLGVMWPFVVRKALQQPTVEAALACITGAKLAGAHNYLLLGPRGEGFVIEAMPTAHHVTPLAGVPLAHTNHCLAPRTRALSQERLPAAQQSSEARLADAHRLLAERPITVEALMGLTRDEQHICYDPDPETHVSTCGAVVMRPKTGDFWAVRGKPSATPYRHYTVGRGAS